MGISKSDGQHCLGFEKQTMSLKIVVEGRGPHNCSCVYSKSNFYLDKLSFSFNSSLSNFIPN